MPKKPSKPSVGLRIASGIAYSIFLLLALAVGTVYGWAKKGTLVGDLIRDPLGMMHPRPPGEVFGGRSSFTFLLLGCDEDRFFRGTLLHGSPIQRKYARADMILVAKLDFAKNTITGVSIPRDTECTLPGYGRRKINAYHAVAKADEADAVMEQAVEHVLPGVDIDRVLVIDYDAFRDLVDTVGGVDVTVPKAMNYDDNAGDLHIHLKPGKQRLAGQDAMGYVRFRHDRESDFGRQSRQKEFLSAFKEAIFRDKTKLVAVAEQGKSVLNDSMSNEEIISLAFFARSVPQKNIALGMVPVLSGRGSFLKVDEERLPGVLEKFGLAPAAAARQSDRK